MHAHEATSGRDGPQQMPESSCRWLGLEGKVCAVTGAGGGIGAAIADSFARAGARVALIDRNIEAAEAQAERLRGRGAAALAFAADVAEESTVRAAADRARAAFGSFDALINNAGLLRAGPLEAVALADWNAVLAINLTGYLICAREFGRDMLQKGKGALVHIASISAVNPQTRSGAYSASKAGVLLLSRQLAAEWGPKGVRSNAILPGMIRTPLSAKFYEEPGFEARRAAATASRRIGEPADIAEPAIFLASDRAAYVNGAELLVDGGLDCMLMDMVPRPGFNATA